MPSKWISKPHPVVHALLILTLASSGLLMAVPAASAELTPQTTMLVATHMARLGPPSEEAYLSEGSETQRLGLVDTTLGEAPATPIHFELDTMQTVRVEVLGLDGHSVYTIAEGLWASGRHVLGWFHTDHTGEELPRGLYLVRLATERSQGGPQLAR